MGAPNGEPKGTDNSEASRLQCLTWYDWGNVRVFHKSLSPPPKFPCSKLKDFEIKFRERENSPQEKCWISQFPPHPADAVTHESESGLWSRIRDERILRRLTRVCKLFHSNNATFPRRPQTRPGVSFSSIKLHQMERQVQYSAKRWRLGYLNLPPWAKGVKHTGSHNLVFTF